MDKYEKLISLRAKFAEALANPLPGKRPILKLIKPHFKRPPFNRTHKILGRKHRKKDPNPEHYNVPVGSYYALRWVNADKPADPEPGVIVALDQLEIPPVFPEENKLNLIPYAAKEAYESPPVLEDALYYETSPPPSPEFPEYHFRRPRPRMVSVSTQTSPPQMVSISTQTSPPQLAVENIPPAASGPTSPEPPASPDLQLNIPVYVNGRSIPANEYFHVNLPPPPDDGFGDDDDDDDDGYEEVSFEQPVEPPVDGLFSAVPQDDLFEPEEEISIHKNKKEHKKLSSDKYYKHTKAKFPQKDPTKTRVRFKENPDDYTIELVPLVRPGPVRPPPDDIFVSERFSQPPRQKMQAVEGLVPTGDFKDAFVNKINNKIYI